MSAAAREANARHQRQVFEGREHDAPSMPIPRTIVFRGGPHGKPERAWCSCCYAPAPHGVAIFAHGQEPGNGDPHVFLCVACCRRIGEACP